MRQVMSIVSGVINMVNGRRLEDELSRIDDFFSALSMEKFEEMVLDCGAGVIDSSVESVYVRAIPKRYVNVESTKKYREGVAFEATLRETEAA